MTRPVLKRLKRHDDEQRRWPGYLFGGHLRTSTLVLVVAFIALWWVYRDHQESLKSSTKTTQVPATQVVPPGYVPDPNYTWVPRTRVQEPPTTVTPTTTPTTTPTPTPTATTTTTPPPPFTLPTISLPTLPPPFGPPATTTAPPPPGQGPAPPAAPTLPGLP